jgi:hypothetical protein
MAKDKELKGMDAVIAKSEGRGRKPVLKRKPGLAIMIAVGKPKGDEPMGKGRALNRALDRVKAPSDNESLLAELDDLNERVAKLEQMMDKMHGEKPESLKHEMGKGDTEEDSGEY